LPEQPGTSSAQPAQHATATGFLRRRFFAILIPTLVVAGAALAFSLWQEKEYEAETSLLFRDTGPALASAEPQREAATNIRLLQNPGLRDRVDEVLGPAVDGSVDIVAETESNLATIIATAPDPRDAARLANTYAEEYIALREESYSEELAQEQQAVQAALDDLAKTDQAGAGKAETAALESRLEELRLAAVSPTGVSHVNPADPPSSASSPKPLQNTLIGALVGLALGVLLAIAMERRDRRVRDPRYIEYVLGRPIIGRIPRSRALAKTGRTTQALPPAEAEAFRTVRANLRQQLREQGARSVLVTSAIPNEGKTTVVWNLARVAAAGGARVLLVEADMRRPALAHSLAANGAGKAGLAELLAGEAQLADLIRTIDFQEHGEANDGHGSVDVLFAGTPPANPSELLDSQRMQAILEVVPDSYDLVIVDTPPTVVSDAMPIVDHVGGVLVVGRLGMSTDESLMELREQLDKLDAPTLGVVVNGGAAGLTPHWRTGAVRS